MMIPESKSMKKRLRRAAPHSKQPMKKSRSRSRSIEREHSAQSSSSLPENLNKLFQIIVIGQRIDGSWTDKSLVATFLNTCCSSLKFSDSNLSQFLSTVTPLLKVGSQDALVSLIVLAILHQKFKDRRNEWNLLEKKAK